MLKTPFTPNKLAKDSAWLFPEYDLHRLHPQKHAGIIIERTPEKGSWEQIQWLFNRYGEPQVAEWVKHHGFRLLSKRSFALWRVALRIEEYAVPDWVLVYFVDAEQQPMPRLLTPMRWSDVKKYCETAVRQFTRRFSQLD